MSSLLGLNALQFTYSVFADAITIPFCGLCFILNDDENGILWSELLKAFLTASIYNIFIPALPSMSSLSPEILLLSIFGVTLHLSIRSISGQ